MKEEKHPDQHFNSQPHKEADGTDLTASVKSFHFNSQPHKEADLTPNHLVMVPGISTHSLTRRLTEQTLQHQLKVFISTHSLTRRLTVSHP